MRQYYYSDGKEKVGPCSLEELKKKQLAPDTLIWHEGLENWTQLKLLTDLTKELDLSKVPPPLPIETEISGHLKVTTEKLPNKTLESLKPTRTTLTWLIIWCSFHLFALLMSYSQIEIFNDAGESETDQFWPFVKFSKTYDKVDWSNYSGGGSILKTTKESSFYGIFKDYDFTEFLFYVGAAIIIFLLSKITNKPNQESENTKI